MDIENQRFAFILRLWIGSIILMGIGVSVIVYGLYFIFGWPVIYTLPATTLLAVYVSYYEENIDWNIFKYPFSHR
jgi:hypothetical protein